MAFNIAALRSGAAALQKLQQAAAPALQKAGPALQKVASAAMGNASQAFQTLRQAVTTAAGQVRMPDAALLNKLRPAAASGGSTGAAAARNTAGAAPAAAAADSMALVKWRPPAAASAAASHAQAAAGPEAQKPTGGTGLRAAAQKLIEWHGSQLALTPLPGSSEHYVKHPDSSAPSSRPALPARQRAPDSEAAAAPDATTGPRPPPSQDTPALGENGKPPAADLLPSPPHGAVRTEGGQAAHATPVASSHHDLMASMQEQFKEQLKLNSMQEMQQMALQRMQDWIKGLADMAKRALDWS
ncbi:hypothetical protein OOT46_03735 [Aquabacterium sp. A7-Y]|uniref:hypothetical protein n=1 Tax=Aquabacterium sp. A7-Y TaxID=1349605 RepID=UPI00223E1E68|nr:hypothetical protein [Aquabacterium sp. A7-Y]MCW7536964.1 hypothetical protein [Aquabacterium sp. A7-Y]